MKNLTDIQRPQDIHHFSDDELVALARQIRQKILKTVAASGGHLASNLGVVELTLALHRVFNCPEDKIIWDVGHQAYTHKLLTGRYAEFATIRQYGGISGYPKIEENVHDAFGTGHSSTSLSAALGMAIARDLNQQSHEVVAVIGDGSLTGGMAWEALNNIGDSQRKVIVIINDNQMSISENIGALPNYLNKLRIQPSYERTKQVTKKILDRIPCIGKGSIKLIEKLKNSIKYLLVNGIVFEELGFTYIGPVKGHDITALTAAYRQATLSSVPVIVHCITEKGKGYTPAERHPNQFHGVSPFNLESGQTLKATTDQTFSQVFGETICELAEQNPQITAITAAMTRGVGLTAFSKRFPDRFFDVAIAEQHALTLAAGMAAAGLQPIVAIYSTFMQRAYDQIIHDVALQKLPVVMCFDRAGLVGADGATHHGAFDLSYLRLIPNLAIMVPANGVELKEMLKLALEKRLPVALRYPRGSAELEPSEVEPVSWGKAQVIQADAPDLVFWACGRMVQTAIQSSQLLAKSGIASTVVNGRFMKPFDYPLLEEITAKARIIVTLEDNALIGGLAELVASHLQRINSAAVHCPVGLPDYFVNQGKISELDQALGIDYQSVANQVLKIYKAQSGWFDAAR